MSGGQNLIRRATGTGTAATAVLALLVLCCVFVAVAGPRENLAAETQALRTTFAGTSPLAASAVATTSWGQFATDINGSGPTGQPGRAPDRPANQRGDRRAPG